MRGAAAAIGGGAVLVMLVLALREDPEPSVATPASSKAGEAVTPTRLGGEPLTVTRVAVTPPSDERATGAQVDRPAASPVAPSSPGAPKRFLERQAAVVRWCAAPTWKDDVSSAADRAGKALLAAGRAKEYDALELILVDLRAPGATFETCHTHAVKLGELLAAGGEE